MHCIARGQTSYTYSYWLDNDYTTLKKVNASSSKWHIDLDMSQKAGSLHSLHLQVADKSGNLSSPMTRFFIIEPMKSGTSANVWFDNNPSTMKSLSIDGNVMWVDAKDLPDGFHLLHVQVNGSAPSSPQTSMFIKVPQTQGVDYMTCLLYVDDTLFKQEKVPATGGVVNWSVDADSLSQGLHKANVVVVTPSGAATSAYSAFFLRVPNATEFAAMKCYYAIDGHDMTSATGTVSNGLFHFDLDLSELEDGLHSITYMLNDGKGMGTSTNTQFFMKTPLGGYGIIQYMYWLNDHYDNAVVKIVDPRQKNIKLISLLPMPNEPIHSDCFHFETTGGKPTVYAKNIFHIRFHDAAGYFADSDRPFIDYSVKQEVTGATPLDRLKTNTISTPGDNQIHWFSFNAELGDTTAFKASQATTIQVFAPDGEEVYSVSGSESVTFGGIHTWQEGTYYVALHDVTGSKPTVSLDFMHLAKYDVVRQDVNVVGNGGISTITFDGNGFKDLYAVTLYNSKGDSIKAEAIGFQNDAVVSLTFDFTDAATGVYDAVFHFTTENKKFKNIVTVEEAKDIELALDVKYPSTFLRGTSTTYTITVTNKGNSTAYDVPMEIYLSAGDSFANISSVKFKDENGKQFNNFTLADIDIAETDSIDEETMAYLEDFVNELNGLQSFIVTTDSISGSEYGFTDQLLTIAPRSSQTFYVEIKSSAAVKLNVRIPGDWITVHSESEVAKARSQKSKASESNLCCVKEKWECTVNIVANVVGMIPIAGCVSALVDEAFFNTYGILCADGESSSEKFTEFYASMNRDKEKHKAAIGRSVDGLIGCVSGFIGKLIKNLAKKLRDTKKARDATHLSRATALEAGENAKNNAAYCQKKADEFFAKGDYDNYTTWQNAADNAIKDVNKYAAEESRLYREAQELDQEIGRLTREIDDVKSQLSDMISAFKNGVSALKEKSKCYQAWRWAEDNCPPKPKNGGGSSTPVASSDPNDIYGYMAESGSNAVKDGLTDVYYRIEFENDTAFATAPAHDIWLTDTLDASKFDLSTFKPTRIKIGEKTAELTGEQNFVTTVDMRPGINAIAQVEGTYDRQKGIARWHISSLDPMTMEPTKYVQDGVLPVNTDGRGLGEVMYDISLKPGLVHGTEIKNRAGIVFDTNDVIMTPTWTNTIDRVKPESRIVDATLNEGGETAAISIEASDEGSGPWRYDVYVQYGSGAWFLAAENVPADTVATVKLYDGIEHHFYSVARDMAGNVEQKEAPHAEFTLTVSEREHGDVNGDGAIDVADIADIIDTMARGTYRVHADANNDGAVDVADIAEVISIMAARARAAAAEAEALEE